MIFLCYPLLHSIDVATYCFYLINSNFLNFRWKQSSIWNLSWSLDFLHLMPAKFSNIFRNQFAAIRGRIVCIPQKLSMNVLFFLIDTCNIDWATVSDWAFDWLITCSVFLRGQSRSPLRVGKHSIIYQTCCFPKW